MITHRLHAMSLACFDQVCTVHLALDCDPNHIIVLVLELVFLPICMEDTECILILVLIG